MHLYKIKKKSKLFDWAAPLLTLALALAVFFTALSRAERASLEDSALLLKRSINRAAYTCYAVEGCYPHRLQYLLDNYGVSFDSNRFIVSYEAFSDNVMPSITVLDLEGG